MFWKDIITKQASPVNERQEASSPAKEPISSNVTSTPVAAPVAVSTTATDDKKTHPSPKQEKLSTATKERDSRRQTPTPTLHKSTKSDLETPPTANRTITKPRLDVVTPRQPRPAGATTVTPSTVYMVSPSPFSSSTLRTNASAASPSYRHSTPTKLRQIGNTPLRTRIRHEILRMEDQSTCRSSTTNDVKTTDDTARRKRLMKNKHLLHGRSHAFSGAQTAERDKRQAPTSTELPRKLHVSTTAKRNPGQRTIKISPKQIFQTRTPVKSAILGTSSVNLPEKSSTTDQDAKSPTTMPDSLLLPALKLSDVSNDNSTSRDFSRDDVNFLRRKRYNECAHSIQLLKRRLPVSSSNAIPLTSQLYVRKRPALLKGGDFDVVEMNENKIVLFNTTASFDKRTLEIKPLVYDTAAAFHETTLPDDVCHVLISKVLAKSKHSGEGTLVLLSDQSGYVQDVGLKSVAEKAMKEILRTTKELVVPTLELISITGNTCHDLLDPYMSVVQIVKKDDGSSHFKNATSLPMPTPEAISAAIARAHSKIDIKTTNIVCRITLWDRQPRRRNCLITLAMCCKKDLSITQSMTNYQSSEEFAPTFSSTLSCALEERRIRQKDSLFVYLTVSASAYDTEETLSLLKIFENTQPSGPSNRSTAAKEAQLQLPKVWDHGTLVDWLRRKHLYGKTVNKDVNGRLTMRMTKDQLRNAFYDDDVDKADLLYRCLRAENDRVARLLVKRKIAKSISAAE